ncbi:unnamed protein product [Mytilus coruscus]|uniref:HAT C-terminal dimerisation domain-containing protein n=1 Tax=Mytilus coruscus TaxID=42192 RepID=A0A6J8DNJ8_MYTCO|nr:unnamed protein product [Mytilus coruscus]
MENNILDQFDLSPDTDGTFKAKSRHWPALISGSLKIASNLKTHIKRKHREVLEIKETQQKTLSAKVTTFYQPTSNNKYHSNDVKQKMSTDALIMFIADNASNMVKAFKTYLPGFEDTTDDGDSGNDKPEDIDCDDENEDEFEHLSKHSRCYAHSLQLVIKDGLKDCTSHMCTVIAKASKIVNFVRRSIHASEMLESENKLQAANVTRWNSQLTMIKSILKLSEEKLNKVDSPVKLSSYERKILHELSLILDPFEYVTLLVQNNVSASLTIPVTQYNNMYNNKMMTTLKSSIETRLTRFEEDNDFILAAILDPRFKLRWSDTFDQEEGCSPPPPKKLKSYFFSFIPPTTPSKSRHRSGAVHDVDIYLSEPCEEISINPLEYWKSNSVRLSSLAAIKYLAIPSSSAPVERSFSIAGKVYRPDRCSLNDSTFIPPTTPSKSRHRFGAVHDVDIYLSEPCEEISINPLEYWKSNSVRLSSLANTAIKYLAIPSTSAPVERSFSIAGKVYRPDRCSLNDSTFETLTMSNCNGHVN